MSENLNSKEYWDKRFEDDWEKNSGRQQSRYFAELAMNMMPKKLLAISKEENFTWLDWGCALGDGTQIIANAIGIENVCGLDFSTSAIETALVYFPNLQFMSGSLLDYDKKYDIIFSSNCMEHFKDPHFWLNQIFDHANNMVILLLPFQEYERLAEHEYTFDYHSFNFEIKGFHCVFHKTTETNPDFWPGKQILVVYIKDGSEIEKNLTLEIFKNYNYVDSLASTSLLRKLKEESKDFHKQIQKLHEELINMSNWNHNILKELEEKNIALKNEIDKSQDLRGELSDLSEKYEKENANWQDKQAELKSYMDNLIDEITNLNKDNDKLRMDNIRLGFENTELYQENSNIGEQCSSLHSDISSLHEELTKMSQWAHSMKSRLDFFDKFILIRAIEKLNKNGLNWFVKSLFKRALRRIIPPMLSNRHHMKKKENDFDILKSDVEQSGHNKFIIVFPVIDWNFRHQRPQHIVSQFADEGFTVLYLNMEMTPIQKKIQNKYEALDYLSYNIISKRIYQINLVTEKPINIYQDTLANNDLNNALVGLSTVLDILNYPEPLYLVHHPGWASLVYEMKRKFGGKIMFDCMDDHSGFNSNSDDSVKSEIELIKKSDLVITTADLLNEKVNRLNKNTILVRNGTEFEHFNNISPNGELEYLTNNPIIGYYGAISDWFDVDMVEYAAQKHPDWNFVLIGSTWGCDISKLSQISNVYFLGEKPYKDLPGYLYYFDVCIIPFKLIPLTLATNPVKFYEYLSAGKPVVSVCLPELRHYKDFCYLAENKEDFVEKISFALNENPSELMEPRIQLARENSWKARFIQIKQGMEKKFNE
ncbi:methyltransferase domain-containing protein [Paenibacillus sp. YN15]|uniref:methyltransferase domain-containing protein n=1 Tax=Paenibacillus sp. YN15 TaxID=1742774 RepID=UPI000DCD83E4|nr:methyltransferase domain-containing protein [Paenibacillus sp. YN15]RAU93230.1 hypothetical protein DQG13_26265 [Paenibacillus sp. YN15]